MRVEIDIQRAEAIQLIQAVGGQQHDKLEKCLHALLTYAEHCDIKQYNKYSIFNIKRGNSKTRLSTTYYPTAYNLEKDPNWKQKCARLPWPIDKKNVPTGKKIEAQEESSQRNKKELFELLTLKNLSCLQTF